MLGSKTENGPGVLQIINMSVKVYKDWTHLTLSYKDAIKCYLHCHFSSHLISFKSLLNAMNPILQ